MNGVAGCRRHGDTFGMYGLVFASTLSPCLSLPELCLLQMLSRACQASWLQHPSNWNTTSGVAVMSIVVAAVPEDAVISMLPLHLRLVSEDKRSLSPGLDVPTYIDL